MAVLVIRIEVDVDQAREDPHEVAEELLDTDRGGWGPGGKLRDYCGADTRFLSARWEDRR